MIASHRYKVRASAAGFHHRQRHTSTSTEHRPTLRKTKCPLFLTPPTTFATSRSVGSHYKITRNHVSTQRGHDSHEITNKSTDAPTHYDSHPSTNTRNSRTTAAKKTAKLSAQQTNERTNERTNGRTNEGRNEGTKERKNKRTNERTNERLPVRRGRRDSVAGRQTTAESLAASHAKRCADSLWFCSKRDILICR